MDLVYSCLRSLWYTIFVTQLSLRCLALMLSFYPDNYIKVLQEGLHAMSPLYPVFCQFCVDGSLMEKAWWIQSQSISCAAYMGFHVNHNFSSLSADHKKCLHTIILQQTLYTRTHWLQTLLHDCHQFINTVSAYKKEVGLLFLHVSRVTLPKLAVDNPLINFPKWFQYMQYDTNYSFRVVPEVEMEPKKISE